MCIRDSSLGLSVPPPLSTGPPFPSRSKRLRKHAPDAHGPWGRGASRGGTGHRLPLSPPSSNHYAVPSRALIPHPQGEPRCLSNLRRHPFTRPPTSTVLSTCSMLS